jgi:hypothetical protein
MTVLIATQNNRFGYIKVTNNDCVHDQIVYTDGLVEDVYPLDKSITRYRGGLTISGKDQWWKWVCNNNNGISPQEYIWDAEIPEGEEFVDMGDQFKSRRIIVSNKRCIWTDYDMCMWLVSKNGALLKHVRVEHTHELCLAAAKNCGQSIMFAKVVNKDIWLAAVKQYGLSIKWIPADKRDAELYTEAVKERPLALEHVPENLQTYDMCMDAVSKYGFTLSYVKIPMTKDLVMAAVCNFGTALRFGHGLIDNDIIMAAVTQQGLSLMYAPFQTKEICMYAVKNNRHAIDYVKDIYKYECQKYINENY